MKLSDPNDPIKYKDQPLSPAASHKQSSFSPVGTGRKPKNEYSFNAPPQTDFM